MKERIQAVQRVYWTLCAAGVLVVLLGIPLGRDAETMKMLEELNTFAAGFDERALEASLLGHVREQGKLPLKEIAQRITGEGVPRVVADGPPVEPSARVDLATIGHVHAMSLPGASVEIAVPDAAFLAAALGWRLVRQGDAATAWVLRRVAIEPGAATDAEIERERETEAARLSLLAAEQSAADAVRVHESAAELVEQRRKWRASWKAQLKAAEARDEARVVRDARAAERDEARSRYETLAKAAEAFGAGAQGGSRGHGVVAASLERAGGARMTFVVPVPLARRAVGVGRLQGADFPVARASPLWDELAASAAESGVAVLLRRFSWHYTHVEYGGAKFGGTTALQVAPMLCVVLLGFLLRRTHGVGRSYNPFDLPAGAELPAVGVGLRAVDAMVLLGMPLVGCALCTWSLVQLAELVVVPVLSGALTLAFGGWAIRALAELANLRDEVMRTHSRVPDAPRV